MSDRPWTWFGTSTERFLAARRTLAHRPFVAGGPLLNAALQEHRTELLAFDDCLEYRDELAWHASDLAERNPYVSSFPTRAAAELARNRLESGVEVIDDFGGRAHALRLARAALRRFSLPTGRSGRPAEQCDVFLVTWAGGDYFGDLPQRLRAAGKRVSTLTLLGREDGAYTLEDVVGARRVAELAARSLRPPARVAKPFVVGGVDLTPLLEDELRREAASLRHVWSAQLAEVGPWLARHGVRPERVVHPFENQAWEKVLRIGVRRALPETEVVGYQHTPTSFPGWFPCAPSRRDLGDGQLPDRIVLLDERWVDEFAAAGYPRERLEVGEPLRYAHLADARRGDPEFALAVCAGDYDEALELAHKAIEPTRGERLLIKTHPDQRANDERFRRALGPLPPNVAFTDTPIAELLPRASRVLHTFTAVAWEAIAYGVPTEFVPSDFRIDVNPLA